MIKFKRKGLWIYYFSDSFLEIESLEDLLTVRTDKNKFNKNRFNSRDYVWDGSFKFFEKRYRRFKYGFLDMVKENLELFDIKFKVENDFEKININIRDINNELYLHQKEGVINWFKKPYGILKIPTRGGKTFTASEIMRLIGEKNILYVVDNQLLFNQAVNDIRKYLKINKKEIGKIIGEQYIIKNITIASIQTLQSIFKGVNRFIKRNKRNEKLTRDEKIKKRRELNNRSKELVNYLQNIKYLFVDECHEFGSDERFQVLSNCENINGALFMSATPENIEKEKDFRIKGLCGNVFYEVKSQTLKERKILSDEKVMLILMDHNKNKNIKLDKNSTFLDFEREVIIKNERRDNCIINIIQILNSINIKTLVLFEKINHGKFVERITGFEYLTGGTKLDIRINTLKRFNKTKGGVLLATNIFNKGLTLPSTQVLLNAGGGLNDSKIIQKKGRVLGVTEQKNKALIIDFADNYEYFNEHSLSRIAVYEKEAGMKNIFVFDFSDENFYSDVREFLINWK